tara:strand:+ start:511 stop:810 length:300 start_codon:yes stop_codon:yes gene_type:complete
MISFRGFMESLNSDFIPCMLAKRYEDWAKRKCVTGVPLEKVDDFGRQTTGLTASLQTRVFKRCFDVNKCFVYFTFCCFQPKTIHVPPSTKILMQSKAMS